MRVNPVSMGQILNTRKTSNQSSVNTLPVIKQNGVDKVTFTAGPNPEVLKNQLKILLTQDIWAVKLKVKMPETPLEQEALLEVLQNRLKLDRFTRLKNEQFIVKTKANHLREMMSTDPSNPQIPALQAELARYGNIDSYMKTVEKAIDLEANRKKPALDYFKNLEQIEDEYWEKRLIKTSMVDKFRSKVEKNNINPDGKYSTQELIDIVKSGKSPITAKAEKTSTPILSKKQLLLQAEKKYEQLLRENVDVYEGRMNHNDDARNARKIVNETYLETIKKFPEAAKQLNKTYEAMEAKFMHKISRMENVDIYPIGEIWSDMKVVETSIKKSMQDLTELRAQLAQNPNSKKIKDAISSEEKNLHELQQDWLNGLRHSIKYERINRERMSNAGKLAEYDYLTGENKTLKRHKEAFEIYKNNDESIPENLWTKVLG